VPSWVKAIWRWTSKWLSGFIGRLPIYVLPLVLLGIEFFFRSATKHDAHAFIGPTAAAAGIALLIPTVTGRPLTLDKMDRLEALYKKTYECDQNPWRDRSAYAASAKTHISTVSETGLAVP